MKYTPMNGTMKNDKVDIRGWGMDLDLDCTRVGEWPPFSLCVYGSLNPHMTTREIIEQIHEYLGLELRRMGKACPMEEKE